MPKRLRIRANGSPALIITRASLGEDNLVYVAIANKKIRYSLDRSPIVYIGTTKKGPSRIAGSAAHRAKNTLVQYGVKNLTFYVVTCKQPDAHRKLETALLIVFREIYGDVPICNVQGKHRQWRDERSVFSENRLRSVIKKYSLLTHVPRRRRRRSFQGETALLSTVTDVPAGEHKTATHSG